MYNELKTGDDAWMKSVHERIDRLSVVIDGLSKDGGICQKRMNICVTGKWHAC